MHSRILSAALFLVGFGVMGLSNFTAFFRVTRADPWAALGMGVYGLLACLLSIAMLPAPEDAGGDAPEERRLYSALLFLAGLLHMNLGFVTVFFHATAAAQDTAIAAAFGGLILCLLGWALLPAGA